MIKKTELQKPKSRFLIYTLYGVLFLLVFLWAFKGINYKGVMATARGTFKSMGSGILNPDLEYIKNTTIDGLGYALLETLAIAISGTFISAVISLPIALLASQNIVGKKVGTFGKFLITCIRVFPELILAIIFIKILGPGAMAGVMALGIHSIGMLGKLFSEAIESMDMGSVEALEACGATSLQKLFHGVIPEILPALMGFSLYRFEINTRSASTLGIVGAGGIGAPLLFAITGRNWPRTFTLVFALIITVVLVDLLSGKIRRRIQ
ncbi:MAG: phosphonate ABC transporter, permease protein PhnE [Tissierellia bacterium]|nr:phosphonate ABC transporter, permease protein PhnE [Tissierellia bacterium]